MCSKRWSARIPSMGVELWFKWLPPSSRLDARVVFSDNRHARGNEAAVIGVSGDLDLADAIFAVPVHGGSFRSSRVGMPVAQFRVKRTRDRPARPHQPRMSWLSGAARHRAEAGAADRGVVGPAGEGRGEAGADVAELAPSAVARPAEGQGGAQRPVDATRVGRSGAGRRATRAVSAICCCATRSNTSRLWFPKPAMTAARR